MIALWIACRPDDPAPERLTETGWFQPSTTATCADLVVTTVPEAGDADWSWRAVPRVWTSTPLAEAYDATLVDPYGVVVPVQHVWSTDGGTWFDVVPPAPLVPNAPYLLTVIDCARRIEIPFDTAPYGLPLDGGPASLVDRTWLLDVTGGTWLQPAAVGPLLSLYLTVPVLVGVTDADGSTVDLLGGPGENDPLFGITQDLRADTWSFPDTPFHEQPYFEAAAGSATLVFEGAAVPVEDFALSGTFAADGSSIGDVRISGLGDTADLGPLIGSDDPNAVCDFAASLNVQCEPCSNGSPTCLYIDITDIVAPELVGVTMVPQ